MSSQKELIKWSQHKFDMKKLFLRQKCPNGVKRRAFAKNRCHRNKPLCFLGLKTKQAPEFLDLENALWAWFCRKTKHADITGDLLKMRALRIAAELELLWI